MGWRFHGRASVDRSAPRAFGICGRCGFLYNLCNLQWQFDWRGSQIKNTKLLVCDRCLDVPNESRRTLHLAPDPTPVLNARPEVYYIDESEVFVTESGVIITTEDDKELVTEESP